MFSTTHFHPMLVHFPIALVIIGFVAEMASLFVKREIYLLNFGFYLLLFGTIGAVFSALSGAFFTAELSGASNEIKETHELFAWISVGLLILTSVFQIILKARRNDIPGIRWVSLILYGFATISIMITGFYGGTLVYKYMMPI